MELLSAAVVKLYLSIGDKLHFWKAHALPQYLGVWWRLEHGIQPQLDRAFKHNNKKDMLTSSGGGGGRGGSSLGGGGGGALLGGSEGRGGAEWPWDEKGASPAAWFCLAPSCFSFWRFWRCCLYQNCCCSCRETTQHVKRPVTLPVGRPAQKAGPIPCRLWRMYQNYVVWVAFDKCIF